MAGRFWKDTNRLDDYPAVVDAILKGLVREWFINTVPNHQKGMPQRKLPLARWQMEFDNSLVSRNVNKVNFNYCA